MSFSLSCQCQNLSVLTPRYFIEFGGYSFFAVSLILISSESTFHKHFKITSSVFSILSEILYTLNQLFNCFITQMTCLFRFFAQLFFSKEIYHQSNALYSAELLYEDH